MAYSVAALIVLLDQISKAVVEALLAYGAHVPVIERFFYFVHARNTGAAWSLLADLTWGRIILSAISLAASWLLAVAIKKSDHTAGRIILALILGGSAGNLIDRVRFGYVTDFFSFRFGAYAFPAFNVADMAIVIGAGLLLLFALTDRTFLDRLLPWLDGAKNEPPRPAKHASDHFDGTGEHDA